LIPGDDDAPTMTRTVSLLPLALVTCLLLAGCAAPFAIPTPTETPPPDMEVTLANEGTVTYTLAYWTVDGRVDAVTEVTTTGETRAVENLTGTAGVRLFSPDDVREVRWPTGADQRGSFTLGPGSSVSGPVEDPAPGTTVLFLARTDDRVVAWGTADCGEADALTLVDFTMDERGPGLGIGCEGFGGGGTPDERTGR
jgi:hypothetical protein